MLAHAHARARAPHPLRTFSARTTHATWYAQTLPAMLPIALLGSTVYIGLHLMQAHLARERYLDGATARVQALERELEALRRAPPPPPRASASLGSTDERTGASRWFGR